MDPSKTAITHYQECECNFCGSTLRFEISRVGQLVNCQDCGMETVMFVPGCEPPYPANEYLLRAANIGWSKNPLGTRNVVGIIVNTCNHDLDWVRVEFTLVNRQALPVGSTSDCLIDFPAASVWRFSAPVFQSDAVGVSTPLISCEFGKLLVPKPIVAPPMAAPLMPPPPQRAPMQWTGLRITVGK